MSTQLNLSIPLKARLKRERKTPAESKNSSPRQLRVQRTGEPEAVRPRTERRPALCQPGSLRPPAHHEYGIATHAMCLIVILCAGCHRDMRDQPRYESQEASAFFSDGQADRPLIEGTVARGQLDADDEIHTGKVDGRFSKQIPIPVNRSLLVHGQERFNIYCAPCHAQTGAGDGMIVQRGFSKAPSFHQDRLRQAPAGHFFDVMTHGFGAMPRYSVQIPPHDRWAIVAYIRALQLSQNAKLDDVPQRIQEQLNKEQP